MQKTVFLLCVFLCPTVKAMKTVKKMKKDSIVQNKFKELSEKYSKPKYKFRVWAFGRNINLFFQILYPETITSTESPPTVKLELFEQCGFSSNPEAKQPKYQQDFTKKTLQYYYQAGRWETIELINKNLPNDKEREKVMPLCINAALQYLKKIEKLPTKTNSNINWEIKNFSTNWNMLGLKLGN